MADQKTLNTLAKGAGLVAVGLFFSKVITYLYRAIIAHLIGPEAYGQISQAIAVTSIAGAFAILGLNQGIINLVSKYRTRGEEDSVRGSILSALHIAIPASMLVGAAMFLSADFLANSVFSSPDLSILFKIFALTIPFKTLSNCSVSATVGFQKIKYKVISNQFFQNVVQLLGTVALLLLGYEIVGAAVGWLLGSILSAFLAFYYMKRLLPNSGTVYQHRKIMNYSYPLFLSAIIGSLLGWMDTTLLGFYMNDTQVGFYNAALPTAMLLMIPYNALSSLTFPSMSELVEKESEELENTLKTVTRWSLSASLPVFILIVLFSDTIITILFGREFITTAAQIELIGLNFSSTSLALGILSTGYIFNSTLGYLNDLLKSIDRTKLIFKNNLAQLVLNLILNITLIPLIGIVGAAIATSFSLIFLQLLLLAEAYHTRKIVPLPRQIWKPLLASLVPIPLIYATINSSFTVVPIWAVVLGGIIFGTLYTSILIGIKGFTEEDREIIHGIGRKIGREDEAKRLADLVIR